MLAPGCQGLAKPGSGQVSFPTGAAEKGGDGEEGDGGSSDRVSGGVL